jgi:hypothetical protein
LTLVQKYITGEGQFSYAYHYHMRIFMHLNGDIEMSLPFYLLKSLTKMSKRVQNHPQTARKSLFHQGLMKMLVLYALREVQMTWRQLLSSVGLDEQDTKQEKPKVSKEKGNTSKDSAKLKEVSPVAKSTRSCKRKLQLQQEAEIKQEPGSPVSRHESKGFDRVYTRRMEKQRAEQQQEVKSEPETEACDKPIEKTTEKKQSKLDKGKQVVDYRSRPKTRSTNKLRLNSKALFKPSLKKDNLIIIDEDAVEKVPKKILRARKQPPVPDIELSNSEAEIEQDPTYTPEINELARTIPTRSPNSRKFCREGDHCGVIFKGA